MDSIREYEQSLKGTRVEMQIVEGLNHEQVFDEIDRVFPTLLAFTQSWSSASVKWVQLH